MRIFFLLSLRLKDQASKFLSLVLAALIYGLVKADKNSPAHKTQEN